jgi:hypothetical protein
MRSAATALVIALALVPAAAFAQAGPPGQSAPGGPATPPPGTSGAPPPGTSGAPPPGAITREQFVERRTEAAGRLFDQIDTNHLGYVTRAQLRAYWAQRRQGAAAAGGSPPHQ